MITVAEAAQILLVACCLGLLVEPKGWVFFVPCAIVCGSLLAWWGRWPFRRRASSKPELIRWSPDMPDQQGAEVLKTIIHDGVSICACVGYDSRHIVVRLEVQNGGQKALGFGADGVSLALIYAGRTDVLNCRVLRTRGHEYKTLMVDSGQERWILALFDSAPMPDRVELAIQANRISAPSYLFAFPFEASALRQDADEDTKVEIGTFDELLNSNFPEGASIRVLSREEQEKLPGKREDK